MQRFIRLPALCGLLVLSGCISLGPDYEKPAIPAPAAWDSRQDGTGQWPDADWWRGFGSNELDRLIADGRTGNTDLRAAVARIRQAEAQAKISGAALYPSLDASGSAGRNWTGRGTLTSSTSGSSLSSFSSGNGRIVRNSFGGTLTTGYQVDLFGANAAASDAALTRLESSQYDRETVAITLYADIATTYFQLLSLRDRIRLANETLATAENTLQLLERQQEFGVGTDFEVAQQRSTVATQRATVASLQQTARQTLDSLAVLLGRNPQGFAVQGATLDSLSLPPVVAGLPSELLLRRPDLRKAEADLRAGNLDVVAARAQRFPSLNLTASGGTQARDLGKLFEPSTMLYSILASLSAPIFEGGRLQGQEELSRAREDELLENYRAAILAAFRDTEDALSATASTERQYAFAREAYDQANTAYRIVDARYRAGTVDFLSLLDAQRTVFSANDTLVQAELSRYTAMVDLYKALGGGWTGAVIPAPDTGP